VYLGNVSFGEIKMAFRNISFIRATILTGFMALAAVAQEYMPPTTNPPAADYEPQGEYVGTITGGAKLGAWLVSRGGSKFDVILLPGGLLDLTKPPQGKMIPMGAGTAKPATRSPTSL
jgi:hypothetical protein